MAVLKQEYAFGLDVYFMSGGYDGNLDGAIFRPDTVDEAPQNKCIGYGLYNSFPYLSLMPSGIISSDSTPP